MYLTMFRVFGKFYNEVHTLPICVPVALLGFLSTAQHKHEL